MRRNRHRQAAALLATLVWWLIHHAAAAEAPPPTHATIAMIIAPDQFRNKNFAAAFAQKLLRVLWPAPVTP